MPLPMAEYAYNNTKNLNIVKIYFEFPYNYHPRIFFKDKTDLCLKSRSPNKLIKKLRDLVLVYYLLTPNCWNQAYDKDFIAMY